MLRSVKTFIWSVIKKYVNIKEIAAGEGDDFATGCVLDYRYFNEYYQLTAVDLTK